MLFKKGELRILWPFYLHYFLFGLSTMIIPFMIIYFRDLGFSFLQIAIITASYGISRVLFEIPTGAFADTYSRKYSVIIGLVVTALSVLLIPLFNDFYILLLLWFIVGIGATFVSGAEESLAVDNLTQLGRKDLHQEFFIKNKSLVAFGAIFAPFIGAILVKIYSINLLWFVFGFGFLLNSIILAIFSKELYKPKDVRTIDILKETYSTSKIGLKFIHSNRVLFLLIIGGAFTSLMAIAYNGWQPFLVNLTMPQYALGFMYSIMGVVVMVTPFLSKLFVNFKVKNVVSTVILFRTLLLFSLLFIYPPFYIIAAIIFILDSGTYASIRPLLETYYNKFIPKKIRATVISSKLMMIQLIFSLSSLIGGFFLDIFGPQRVLAFGGLFGILAIMTYLKIKE